MWFLELGHQRVSLGKIWAICQMGRWPVFLDPNSQPFLSSQLADIPEDDRLIEVWLYLSIYAEPAFLIFNSHTCKSISRPVQVWFLYWW